MPPVAGHGTAARFMGLRTFAVAPVWLVSSATTSARQLSTRLRDSALGSAGQHPARSRMLRGILEQ